MVVIGFFRDLLSSFGDLFNFVTTPLKEINSGFEVTPLADLSILGLLGASIGTTLVVLLVIHVVRLFIGG